jgi:hypothetical protein
MAIMLRCKKLRRAMMANSSFYPFKRQKFDLRNAEAFYIAIKFGKSNRKPNLYKESDSLKITIV